MLRTKFLAVAVVATSLCLMASGLQAAIIEVDRDGGAPGPTQAGFLSIPGNTTLVTDGTVTVSDSSAAFEHRDRGAGEGGGGSLDDLIRDLSFSSTSLNIDIAGLDSETEYLVTLWGVDTANPAHGSRFYHGPTIAGTLLASQVAPTTAAIGGDQSLAIAFSTVLTSTVSGSIPLLITADGSVPGASFGFAAFNGLTVEAVIPEPTSLLLLSIGGGMMFHRRRR